jgi:hypothetical protein
MRTPDTSGLGSLHAAPTRPAVITPTTKQSTTNFFMPKISHADALEQRINN